MVKKIVTGDSNVVAEDQPPHGGDDACYQNITGEFPGILLAAPASRYTYGRHCRRASSTNENSKKELELAEGFETEDFVLKNLKLNQKKIVRAQKADTGGRRYNEVLDKGQ